MHKENINEYKTVLNICNPQQRSVIEFLTNTDKAVVSYHDYAEGLEEELDYVLEEQETSQQFGAASSNKQWGQPSDFSNSFSTSWNTPSYSHYGQSFSFGFGDGIGYTVSGFPDTGCGTRSVETKENVHPDLSEEASSAVAKETSKMGSSSIAPYETVSDENRKCDAPLRAQQRSGPIANVSFEYREELVRKAFYEISWTQPKDRIQRLIVSISIRELNEHECLDLMKMLKAYESKEKDLMNAAGLGNMECNDYFHRIAYKDGKPFLILEGSGLPGAVNDLHWMQILYYKDCGSTHPTKVQTDEFLARVNKNVLERRENGTLVAVRAKILTQIYKQNS